MTTTAQKWGGSTGIRIPQHLAKKYNIVPGTRVQVSDDGEKIVLKPERETNIGRTCIQVLARKQS